MRDKYKKKKNGNNDNSSNNGNLNRRGNKNSGKKQKAKAKSNKNKKNKTILLIKVAILNFINKAIKVAYKKIKEHVLDKIIDWCGYLISIIGIYFKDKIANLYNYVIKKFKKEEEIEPEPDKTNNCQNKRLKTCEITTQNITPSNLLLINYNIPKENYDYSLKINTEIEELAKELSREISIAKDNNVNFCDDKKIIKQNTFENVNTEKTKIVTKKVIENDGDHAVIKKNTFEKETNTYKTLSDKFMNDFLHQTVDEVLINKRISSTWNELNNSIPKDSQTSHVSAMQQR